MVPSSTRIPISVESGRQARMFLFSIHKPTHPSIMIDLAVRCQCTERLADTGADARPVRFDVQDTRDSIVKREDVTHAHFSEVGQKYRE